MKVRVIYCLCRSPGVCVCGRIPPPPQWDGAMLWRARRRVSGAVLGALRSGVPPLEGERKRRGGVYGKGRVRIPLLPEEVEAHTVLPLRTGHADAGRWKPGPSDLGVGSLYQSDIHST